MLDAKFIFTECFVIAVAICVLSVMFYYMQ